MAKKINKTNNETNIPSHIIEDQNPKGLMIAVLDNGFVYVGRTSVRDNDWVVIEDSSNIRRYGTTRGLGELALEGPKGETTLDPVGTVIVKQQRVCHLIVTKESLWEKHLKK